MAFREALSDSMVTKAKPRGLPRVAVGDQAHGGDLGMRGEVAVQVVFGGVVGQVADVDVQGALQ